MRAAAHWHNARMQRAAGWIGRRDGMLAIGAVVIGLTVGYVDSQPTWDDTGITVALLLLTSGMVAGISGRRPWLWALVVGAWVPLFELTGTAGVASLAALAVAAVGAFGGYAAVRVVEPG
jgi:hypothetical protein